MENYIATYYDIQGNIIHTETFKERTEHEAENEATGLMPKNCDDWTLKTEAEAIRGNLESLKAECAEFQEKAEGQIYDLCHSMNERDSHRFSYNIDRLRNFMKELNEFEMTDQPQTSKV